MTALSRTVADVLVLFRTRGDQAYLGEAVSMSAHMLQAAALAEREDAEPELVGAALLHDIGHLLQDEAVDDHEALGAAYLEGRFSPMLAACARLHVPAKRYLVTTDPAYLGRLSSESLRTLAFQGGAMTSGEVAAFQQHAFAAAALRVRRWDDEAKQPGAATRTVADYAPLLERLAAAS